MKILLLILVGASVWAADAPKATRWESARLAIPDVSVIDQDGRNLHFYTDLVQGRTVAIQFVFTTCTTICTPLGATFRQVQKRIPDLKDVHLISISVDPDHDRPEDLKEFAAKFGAEPGWTLVTGERNAIEKLLKSLQIFTADKSAHSALVIIDNDRSGQWTRRSGLSPAASLAAAIRETAAQKPALEVE
ncbi:MAG: SCO family protein [Acidobacteriota bacterium]|nr:SCO family protein [Acidobacteriota bacterium]